MKTETIETINWMEEVDPLLLANLNELLVAKGIEPLATIHGGAFKDGKWVGITESEDYRNYWHAYIELWGEHLNNDSYQRVYFDEYDDTGWDSCKEHLRKWAIEDYEHTDPEWTDDLVTAMRKIVKEHFPKDEKYGGHSVVFWWSW